MKIILTEDEAKKVVIDMVATKFTLKPETLVAKVSTYDSKNFIVVSENLEAK